MLCGTGVETAHAQERAHGDVVNGDTLTYPEPSKAAASAVTRAAKSTGPAAAINSINTRINLFDENCLFTFARVNVTDAAGDAILGLGEADFTIREDASNGFQNPLDYFVIPPQGTATTAADIIFAVDNSGSMGPFQTEIDDNFNAFLAALQGSGIDFQLGLVRYGQSGDGSYRSRAGWPIIENGGNLTPDGAFFKNDIFSKNVAFGGNEPGYEAIEAAVQRFNLRPEAQTIVIVVSDETLNQDTGFFGNAATEADALAALQNNNATLFSITDTEDFFGNPTILVPEAQALTGPTGGDIFDLGDNYNDILNSITTQIAGVYTVGYIPADPFMLPDPRDLEIDVDIGGGTTLTTPVASYTPGAAPVIRREGTTADQLATTGGTVTLKAEVKDLVSPGVTGVTLFYRTTGSGSPYASQAMTLETSTTTGGTYEATVSVSSPGIDYYFQTSDGTSTVTAPGVDPAANPFQIGAGGNSAPDIVHTPLASFTTGDPVTVSAEVTDDNALSGVPTLFYRQQGRIGYQSVPMTNTSGDTYEADIPGSDVTSFGLDYYIAATDNDGVTRTFATPDFPVVVGGCVPIQQQCVMPQFTESQRGEQVTVTMNANDPDGLVRADFVDSDGDPFLNNLTVVDSDGFTSTDGIRWSPPTPAPATATFVLERENQGVNKASFFLVLENSCGEVLFDPPYEFADVTESFALYGSYPNPTRGMSMVSFTLDEAAPVQLAVYDVMGRRVATLVDQPMQAGAHEVRWDGRSASGSTVASGVYLLRLEAGERVATQRMTVVR
jgi:hypothetical protein